MGARVLATESMVMAKKTITMYRSAETGRTVTKEYAEAHPKTTEKETRPAPKHPGKKK
jgi:hypothetical protein